MRKYDGRLQQRHPQALLDRARAIAEAQGRDLTDVVRQILYNYVRDNSEPQAEESLGIEQA